MLLVPGQARAGSVEPSLVRVASLVQPMLAELDRWVTSAGGKLRVAVADLRTGQELAGLDAASPENPASNQKLVTAAAALAFLGPRFTYVTGLYGSVSNGRVAELVLRGEGDPSFSSTALENMVKALFARGVREVGEVLVDQSAFDESFVPPAFEQQPAEWAAYRAPISAVALDGNAITFCVQATNPGEPAKVWFEPGGFVEFEGGVQTIAAAKKGSPRVTLKGNGPRLSARVSGSIVQGSRQRWRQRVEDPRWYAGFVLKHLLAQHGIKVGGRVSLGGRERQGELVTHRSKPLAELLQAVGKKSDNFYAEMLLKTLGMKLKGKPGKSADGAEALTAYLKQINGWDSGTRMVNGSGLYDANRVSPRSLTRVLHHAYHEPRVSPDFLAQLAIGGVDGTLASRFYTLKAQRNLLAKTGTLRRIVSLGGYAFARERQRGVTFSFIVSDVIGRQPEVRKRIDKIVEALAKELWAEPGIEPAAAR